MKKARKLAGMLATVLASMAMVVGITGPASASGGAGSSFHNAPGTVHLQSARSGLCIDPLTESVDPIVLIQYTCRNAKSQEWKDVSVIGGKWHWLMNNNSGLCMTPVDPAEPNGSKVVQEPCVDFFNNPIQLWAEFSAGGSVVFLENYYGKCLDLENGDSSVGVEMQVWDCNFNTANQQWVKA